MTSGVVLPDGTIHYDIIVIGTGSGNTIIDESFDHLSVAMVEEGRFGGTCINVGCIPTKMLVYAADTALAIKNSDRLGLSSELTQVRWNDITQRMFAQRIDPIEEAGREYRVGSRTPNVDVYADHAEFIGVKKLQVGNHTLSADQIVLAAGSRTVIPEVISDSGVQFDTNATIMRLHEQPTSLIIYGGGYIAMEFAHIFDALGTQVTIVSRSDLLRHLDTDIQRRFSDIARSRYDLRLYRTIDSLTQDESGITVTLDDASTITAERLLVATGRKSNADRLALDKSGIAMRGSEVAVDDFGETNVPGVWALGDVSSPYKLKHVANSEARSIQHNLLHPSDPQRLNHDYVPAAVFTHPQIATVGLTETEARDQGYTVTVAIQRYADVAYGWAMEDETGIVKLIADRNSGLLLGAHFMGPQASTLIQQLITVMVYHLDIRDFARHQYWIHPALTEVTENALLGLDFAS